MDTNDFINMVADKDLAKRVGYSFRNRTRYYSSWEDSLEHTKKSLKELEAGTYSLGLRTESEWKQALEDMEDKYDTLCNAAWNLRSNEFVTWSDNDEEEIEGVIEYIGCFSDQLYYKVSIVDDMTEEEEEAIGRIIK